MSEERVYLPETPGLNPELMAEVYKALNFNPEEFARRHAEEFTHQYLRLDGMLSYVGEEIVAYLAKRINECLSNAEYALLSYIEYAGRGALPVPNFNEAVSNYLKVRRQAGSDWVYAFERESAKARCLASYPQMHAIAKAMYVFAVETGKFKEIAKTDSPDAWPNPQKVISKKEWRG